MITIIGMLVALLIPAVQAVRARAQQTQCANNIRQIGQALINDASSKGRLPGYVQSVQRLGATSGKSYVLWDGTGLSDSRYTSTPNPLLSRISWAAMLLNRLDRNDIWDRIKDGDVSDPVRRIDVFICPADADANSNSENAALSYVANTGAWDWNGSSFPLPPNMGDTVDNGLFQNLTIGRVVSKLEVKDGSATTLMLSENIHKDSAYSWLGVAGDQPGEQHFGMVWVVDLAPGDPSPPTTVYEQVPFSRELQPYNPTPNQPWYARPASSHPSGAFSVVFVDGHTSSIQPDIDYVVYQQLLTTNGRRCVDPIDWNNFLMPGEPIYEFRNARPLSEQDYQQ